MPTLTAIAPAILVNNFAANSQFEAASLALRGGGRVVAWIDFTGSEVQFVIYKADGSLFLSITEQLGGEKRAPTITEKPDGGVTLTWTETENGSSFAASRDFTYESDPGGNITFSSPGKVRIPVGGNDPLSTSGGYWFDTEGTFVEIWGTNTNQQDIFVQPYDTQRQPIGTPLTVNTTTAGPQSFPVVTGFGDNALVAWTSGTGTGSVFVQQLAPDGSRIGSEQNLGPALVDEGVDIVSISDGRFADVWVRPGTGGGPPQLVVTVVDALNPPTDIVVADVPNGIAGRPSIASLPGGGFVVSWIQDNLAGSDPLLARAYDGSLVPFGPAETIAATARFQISSATSRLNDGFVLFSWDGSGPGDTQGIFTRTYQVTGIGNVPTSGDDELWDGPPASVNNIVINGLGGNDTIRGYAGNDALDGGDGNDVLLGGPGNDAMNGGMGNDFGLLDNPLDSFIGGPGSDTAGVQGNFIGTLQIDATTETVLVASGIDTRWGDYEGNYYDTNITLAALDRPLLNVIATGLRAGEDLVFNGAALTGGGLRVFGGAGLTIVTAGSGNDGSLYGANSAFNPLNTFNGGPGSDTLAFRGNFVGGNAIVLNNNSIVMVDAISLLSGQTNEFGGILVPAGFDYDLTLANGNVAPGGILIISGNNLKANETVDFDGSAELDGALRIYFGAGNDTVVGSAGADLLWGNLGADTQDGGPGADTYVFRSVLDLTPGSQDNIVLGTGDRIDLVFIDANSNTPGINDPFIFIGAAAFSNVAGQLRVFGNLIQGDTNGDSLADLQIGFSGLPPGEAIFFP